MAGRGSDSQKQLLSLIRNFAAEKSQGERRVVTLRKQIAKLTSELSMEYEELEKAKRCKEMVEQDLKGFEVQLMLSEASNQTLEARVSLIQDQISAVGSDLETLKFEEAALREQFFHNMLHMNGKIRKFQESIIICDIDAVDCTASRDESQVIIKENDAEVALCDLESTLSEVISQIAKENEEYQEEQNICKNAQQQLIDCERKVFVMGMIVKETKELQDLTIYPYKYSVVSIGLAISSAYVMQSLIHVMSLFHYHESTTLRRTIAHDVGHFNGNVSLSYKLECSVNKIYLILFHVELWPRNYRRQI
ncbi:hypothetical protein LR48_Vigan03g161200 [Vigna angularis]|uniref:Uncharacterized protein n=1 Tax=Phaseolus angularis TaxID=3914 RepID=A0A0L9U620_PHAAN|nr:uncharacterized protein LOC108328526 isoform X1 [Vigna angularis]KOM38230.1 hypothetical protein LR48_Vigan03g161200 [Vigna angularis]